MRVLVVILGLLTAGGACFAELKLAAVFSDGMVLQRDQEVPVWGWADPGAEVTVLFDGSEKKAKAGADGKFTVHFKKMPASAEPQMLIVKSGVDKAEVNNVLIGEVWLCSGQSNMQWPVSRAKDFDKEKGAADLPLIRMFLTDLKANIQPQQDCSGAWKICSPETVGDFSATAYFFGRELHKELGIPVGLIRSAWGGTCVEAWSPMESLETFPAVMDYKAGMDAKAQSFDEAAEEERFTKAVEAWEEKAKLAKAEGKKVPRKPRKKIHPHKDQNYPANLYNAMIHPLVPYGMRGAIWYQGERNTQSTEGAILYRALLENMVVQWRNDWNDQFPFYAVQLVNYRKPQVEPVEDTGWAFIRESFLKFHKEVPNAGIAIGIDVGEANDIHPKNKQAVGYRLAQQALNKTYGKDIVAGGPVYQSYEKDGNKMVIRFSDTGSGLVEQGGDPLKRFAIAGADRKFFAAHAVIVGDTVIVSSESVPDPMAVRYAWADNPTGCNLFNKEGFPASPFRTDDWPAAE